MHLHDSTHILMIYTGIKKWVKFWLNVIRWYPPVFKWIWNTGWSALGSALKGPVMQKAFPCHDIIVWTLTDIEMEISFWCKFHHWLHWKLSFWQLPVHPMMKIIKITTFSNDVERLLMGFNSRVTFHLYCWLTHWSRDKMVAILQTTFSNAFSW